MFNDTSDTGAANGHGSFESLPPSYGVGANMLAGAFAGIAVSLVDVRQMWLLS